jgi:hypothetical protein
MNRPNRGLSVLHNHGIINIFFVLLAGISFTGCGNGEPIHTHLHARAICRVAIQQMETYETGCADFDLQKSLKRVGLAEQMNHLGYGEVADAERVIQGDLVVSLICEDGQIFCFPLTEGRGVYDLYAIQDEEWRLIQDALEWPDADRERVLGAASSVVYRMRP